MRLKVIAEAGDSQVGEGPDGTLYGRFTGFDCSVWSPIQGWSTIHVPGQPDALEYYGPGVLGESDKASDHLVSNV